MATHLLLVHSPVALFELANLLCLFCDLCQLARDDEVRLRQCMPKPRILLTRVIEYSGPLGVGNDVSIYACTESIVYMTYIWCECMCTVKRG